MAGQCVSITPSPRPDDSNGFSGTTFGAKWGPEIRPNVPIAGKSFSLRMIGNPGPSPETAIDV